MFHAELAIPIVLVAAAILGLVVIVIAVICRAHKANVLGVRGDFASNERTGNINDIAEAGSLHQYLLGLHQRHGVDLAGFYLGTQLILSAASPESFADMADCFDRCQHTFKIFDPVTTAHSARYLSGKRGRHRHQQYCNFFKSTATLEKISCLLTMYTRCLVDEFASAALAGRPVNLTHAAYSFTVNCLGCNSLSDEDVTALHAASDSRLEEQECSFGLQQPSAETLKRCDTCRMEIYKIVRQHLDATSAGVSKTDAKLAENREMVAEMAELLLHGIHATSNLIIWAMYCLCLNQDAQERVANEALQVVGQTGVASYENVAELHYTANVIRETQRWAPLVTIDTRCLQKDRTIRGQTVPAQTPIVTAFGVVQQSPDLWPEPELFKPERFSSEAASSIQDDSTLDSYGMPGRKCPGRQLGHLQSMFILSSLCQHFRCSLVEGQDVSKVFGPVTHPSTEIFMRVKQRKWTHEERDYVTTRV